MTDDSDSDLDVIVDHVKSKVPVGYKLSSLKDPKSLNEMKLKHVKVPNEEDIETIEKSLTESNSVNNPYKVPIQEEPNLIYYV